VLLTDIPTDLDKGNEQLQSTDTSWVFLESSNFVVPEEGLIVNQTTPGFYNGSFLFQQTLPAGTVACSYLVHADSATTETVDRIRGIFETDAKILGVIYGRAELERSSFLERPGTKYATDYSNEYLGVNDVLAVVTDNEDGINQVWWNFHVWSGDVDQMRIITSDC